MQGSFVGYTWQSFFAPSFKHGVRHFCPLIHNSPQLMLMSLYQPTNLFKTYPSLFPALFEELPVVAVFMVSEPQNMLITDPWILDITVPFTAVILNTFLIILWLIVYFRFYIYLWCSIWWNLVFYYWSNYVIKNVWHSPSTLATLLENKCMLKWCKSNLMQFLLNENNISDVLSIIIIYKTKMLRCVHIWSFNYEWVFTARHLSDCSNCKVPEQIDRDFQIPRGRLHLVNTYCCSCRVNWSKSNASICRTQTQFACCCS